ncbi:signal peptidase II [bacterium]|nr:signal peptidase II [bacterium]
MHLDARRIAWLVGIVGSTLVLDQWTKWLVHTRFRVGESLGLLEGFFSLTYIRNQGAAFGIFQNTNPAFRDKFFLAVPVIAIAVITYLYFKTPRDQKVQTVALALVLSGAIGNLIDRLRFGYVIDFLDVHYHEVYHWPAFNVADSCIVVGVLVLFLLSLRSNT